jgi:hypothetical protein
MTLTVPQVTKCTFQKYGPSGSVTRHDGLCILALNIINEKIYVFLWFWFVAVAIFSGAAIIYRAVIMLVPSLRVSVICGRSLWQVDANTVKAIINSKPGWLDQVGLTDPNLTTTHPLPLGRGLLGDLPAFEEPEPDCDAGAAGGAQACYGQQRAQALRSGTGLS